MSIEAIDSTTESTEPQDQSEQQAPKVDIVDPTELAKTASSMLEKAGGKTARVRRDLTYGTQSQDSEDTAFAIARETSLALASEDPDVKLFAPALVEEKGEGVVVKSVRLGYDTKHEFDTHEGEAKPLHGSKFIVFPDGELYMVRTDKQLENVPAHGADRSRIVPVGESYSVYDRVNGYLQDFEDYPSQEAA